MGPSLGADEPVWQPPGVFMWLNVLYYVCFQCLCPQGEPQPPFAPPGDSPRPAGRCSPGSYQITAFALGPSAHEILCVLLKSEVCISPSFLGLVFLMPDPWAGEPDVGLRTVSPVGEPLLYNYSPV